MKKPDGLSGDRVECKEHCKHGSCFTLGGVICKTNKLPRLEVSDDNWTTIGGSVRGAFGHDIPEYECFLHYGVCPIGIVSDASLELWRLYNVTGGLHAQSPSGYYGLPALWVEACTVIEDELRRLRATCGNTKRKSTDRS